ncbi:MAG: agmatine deiminase family protein [Armatimonadetes bacterium]|nr:agmatine deiminase family protein [Armatimonadota bacterium]
MVACQNVNTTLFNPFPQGVDSTQHLDMWMQIIAGDRVIISDWPTAPGSTQDQICDGTATLMAQRGYTVYRTPALGTSSHFTYTNAVMCNDLVMIPTYSQQGMSADNTQALAMWQSALPDKTIVQIDATNIISAAGALHCIVMHVPKNLNGALPGTYLIGPQGGSPQVLIPGEQIEIEWLADDDNAATGIDLWMDAPFGSTRPVPIIRNTSNNGAHIWTVPSTSTLRRFRLRVDAKDAEGNTATSYSGGTFTIQ